MVHRSRRIVLPKLSLTLTLSPREREYFFFFLSLRERMKVRVIKVPLLAKKSRPGTFSSAVRLIHPR